MVIARRLCHGNVMSIRINSLPEMQKCVVKRPSSHKLTRDPWLDLPPVGIGCQGGLRKIESTSEQLRSTLQQHTEDVSIPIGESPTYD